MAIIEEFNPDEVALEAPFYGKNVQSMLKLGRAQGVAMSAALYRDLPIIEYAPKKVKQSVTGNGNASKEQVAKMLMTYFKIKELPNCWTRPMPWLSPCVTTTRMVPCRKNLPRGNRSSRKIREG